MIIKLDHVSYACKISEINAIKNEFPQYKELFRQKLENLSIKKNLCKDFSAGHELVFLSPESVNLLPVEITAYDNVFLQEQFIWVDSNTIHINTNSMQDSLHFFKTVGFKHVSDNRLCLHSLFEPQKVYIDLHESHSVPEWKLDSNGWCCIALLCDSAERQKKKLDDKIHCTAIEQLEVNGNLLDIFFAYGANGEVVEFFSLNNKK